MDSKEKNITIFADTCKTIENNITLQKAVSNSIDHQKLYLENGDNNLIVNLRGEISGCKVIVSGKRSFEAAENYAKAVKKVAVLNFASAANPGGGVQNGFSAQEESLCRCSTLFQCLNIAEMWDKFYTPHRKANDPLFNDDIIYTPDVVVFKSDTDMPETLHENEWYKVDIISCAAPNLKSFRCEDASSKDKPSELSVDDYMKLMKKRISKIFKVAITNNVNVLVLGAFGCGAFYNPPSIVSNLFKEAVNEFGKAFETVEFAIYHKENATLNFNAFQNAFSDSIKQ